MGQVYEPLAFVDTLENAKATPWLATSWAWSDGNRTLTFTIGKGVKFSDGTPMTAADVAYTFNLIKKVPALDVNSVWSVLSSVTQAGDTVVMNFKTPSVPYFYYIADQMPIVPQHVWSKISNPVTYADSNPIGTGAYTVKPVHAAEHHLRRQPGLLAAGRAQDRQGALPGVHLQRPGQHLPGHRPGAVGQPVHPEHPGVLHLEVAGQPLLVPADRQRVADPEPDRARAERRAVRQAMAYAIDRNKVANIGEYGEEPPAQPERHRARPRSAPGWTRRRRQVQLRLQPGQGEAAPGQAGYTLGGNGIFAKGGQQLSFSVINIGGYSDWVASMSVIQQELKAVGIQITPDNLAQNDFLSRLYSGNYQLAYYAQTGGPTPYYESGSGCTRPTRRRSARAPPPTGSGTATRRPTSCSTSTRRPPTRPRSTRSWTSCSRSC